MFGLSLGINVVFLADINGSSRCVLSVDPSHAPNKFGECIKYFHPFTQICFKYLIVQLCIQVSSVASKFISRKCSWLDTALAHLLELAMHAGYKWPCTQALMPRNSNMNLIPLVVYPNWCSIHTLCAL